MGMSFFHSTEEQATAPHLTLTLIRILYGNNPGWWKSRFPFSRLVFILDSDGASGFGYAGTRLPAATGDWFWLPPFLEVEHDQNPSMLHLSVHFNLERRAGIELPRRERRIIHGHEATLPSRIAALKRLPDELTAVAGVKALCWKIIAAVFADPDQRPSLPSAAELTRYSALFDYLAGHLATEIGVAEMAALAGMGKESFAKKFRHDTGCSPKDYLHRLRAGRAGQMLLGTELSVKAIAAELGFCNEFYFSRFFKKQTGVSPFRFRQL